MRVHFCGAYHKQCFWKVSFYKLTNSEYFMTKINKFQTKRINYLLMNLDWADSDIPMKIKFLL